MEPHYLPHAPAHAIPHHRPAEGSFDAESKAALRQIVRFQEHGEVGTRAALPVAVNSVKVRLAHQFARLGRPCAVRILLSILTRA
jgi:hypothetical protein